ncbi:MAG: FliH/SctL family protein [Mizugakiibacter sp.]|uniref:FliH/SctL family protein n=1 Tax=Mizugakiibacter sp. TaxID=1972610 RepID=UPI0031C001AF|nr:flagellar assembly protein FliH [Xanthomonadaceae bacterium]
MSVGGVLSGEQVDAARLWELPEVGRARAQAPQTLRKLESIEEEARAEGYARGLEEGRAVARREQEARVRELEALLDGLAPAFAHLDEAAERELSQLAIAIARQLVRRELRQHPDEVIGVVRAALAALPSTTRHVRVHLHPDDARLVREHLAAPESGRAWEIVEDPLLTRGGCRAVDEASRVDARIETRLGAVIGAVLGEGRSGDLEAAAPETDA